MRIDDFKFFLMLDDNEDELFLTKTIFQVAHPGIPFRCEQEPGRALTHLMSVISAGTQPAKCCVLLDIRMPRTNGFELLYRIRNEIATYDCCVMMLSASRVLDDRNHSTAIGANGYVVKPFKLANLEQALAAYELPAQAV